MIDREYVRKQFEEYSGRYDITQLKIKLKVEHTYRVASLCDRISDSIGLSKEDKDLAWLTGMLHDIARFEQVRIYDSFNDSETVDHATFGADLLFGGSLNPNYPDESKNLIHDYVRDGELEECDIRLVETAIRNHNKYRIDEGMTERRILFCNIIRDADKVDIIKANTDFPLWEIYNVTEDELKASEITKEVYDAFNEGHAVLRSLKKTPVDNIIGHLSLVYELVFGESIKALKEYGYLEKFLEYKSDNPQTQSTLNEAKEKIYSYIEKRIQNTKTEE